MDFRYHPGGDPDAPVEPMTRTDHRLGPNYLRNHPWLGPRKRMVDIYAAADNKKGDLSVFFEADERTGWFYLCRIFADGHSEIIQPVNVLNRAPDFTNSDVEVRWFDNDTKVGVLIKNQLWAFLDIASGKSYRGRYPTAPLKWPSQ